MNKQHTYRSLSPITPESLQQLLVCAEQLFGMSHKHIEEKDEEKEEEEEEEDDYVGIAVRPNKAGTEKIEKALIVNAALGRNIIRVTFYGCEFQSVTSYLTQWTQRGFYTSLDWIQEHPTYMSVSLWFEG